MLFKKNISLLVLITLSILQKATSNTNKYNIAAAQPTTIENTTVSKVTTLNTTSRSTILNDKSQNSTDNGNSTTDLQSTTPRYKEDNITDSTKQTIIDTTKKANITNATKQTTITDTTTINPKSNLETTQNPKNKTDSYEIFSKKDFNFIIFDNTTMVPCTLTMMNITLTVPYETRNNSIKTKNITVPWNANATGTCTGNISILTLMWQESEENSVTVSDGINSLTMDIVKDGDIYYVEYIIVSIFLDNITFPNATDSVMTGNSTKDLKLFRTPLLNGIHKCNKTQSIQAGNMTIRLDNVEFIAFNTNKNATLDRIEEYCLVEVEKSTKQSNAGIIIGGIVIALLAISIIIFLLKRYSNRLTTWDLNKARKQFRT